MFFRKSSMSLFWNFLVLISFFLHHLALYSYCPKLFAVLSSMLFNSISAMQTSAKAVRKTFVFFTSIHSFVIKHNLPVMCSVTKLLLPSPNNCSPGTGSVLLKDASNMQKVGSEVWTANQFATCSDQFELIHCIVLGATFNVPLCVCVCVCM